MNAYVMYGFSNKHDLNEKNSRPLTLVISLINLT